MTYINDPKHPIETLKEYVLELEDKLRATTSKYGEAQARCCELEAELIKKTEQLDDAIKQRDAVLFETHQKDKARKTESARIRELEHSRRMLQDENAYQQSKLDAMSRIIREAPEMMRDMLNSQMEQMENNPLGGDI